MSEWERKMLIFLTLPKQLLLKFSVIKHKCSTLLDLMVDIII